MPDYICEHHENCRAHHVCDHAIPHVHIAECDERCCHWKGITDARCKACPEANDLTGIIQCEVFEGSPQEVKHQFNAWAVEHQNITLEGQVGIPYQGAVALIVIFKELREVVCA